MKNFIIILIFLFLVNCTSYGNKQSQVIKINKIDLLKEYTFEEYVNLLLKINMSKEYPDINNISK
tara:strand:+ start:327 stop:521 length:195 start_codon:yes stop_codon:yes gene_type:complete